MVAVASAADLKTEQQSWPLACLRDWVATAAAVAAACVFGFLIVAGVSRLLYDAGALSQTNDALLRDLPVIEDFEMYQQVEDVDFLRRLHGTGLFAEEEDDV